MDRGGRPREGRHHRQRRGDRHGLGGHQDVGPYEVWAGNPARLIRKRFDEETIERLLKAAWWDWPLERILQMAPLFDDPQALLREVGL